MSTRLLLALMAVVMLMLLPFEIFSQRKDNVILILSPEDEQFRAGLYYFYDYLYVFIDSTDTRTIEEVAAPSFQPHFTQDERWRVNTFGGDQGPEIRYLWGRLTIYSRLDHEEEWLINLDAGEADLFVPIDSGRFGRYRSGGSLPLRKRAFEGSYGMLPCLPLHLPAQDTITIFFRLKRIGFGAVGIGPRKAFSQAIFKPQAYVAVDRRMRFLDALIIGIMLAVLIYHLIIFLYQRQYVSLFFSLFILAFGLIIMEYRGYSTEFLSPDIYLENGIVIVPITWSLVYIFHYLFSRLYLHLPKLLPVWDKTWALFVLIDIISSTTMVSFVLAAGDLADVLPDQFLKIVLFRGFISILLHLISIGAAIAAWRKGNKAARIYFAAMLAFVIQDFAWLEFVNLPFYIYDYFGQATMVLLFAMGIARQLKTLQEEKFAAEQEKLTERAEVDRIRELDAFKSRFYTNITHQFRTPLTIILGMADQIQTHPSTWYNKGAEMIRRNSRLMLNLVNQILDLSKLEAGQFTVTMVRGDVIQYFRYIVESFHSSAERKKIDLKFETELKELVVDYDPDKLMDISSNLISNAIKFTQTGGQVRVKLWVEDNNFQCLRFSVADNGPGIPEEALPRIFDRFYQAGQEHGSQEGVGIGLALTQELVHLLEGKIAVKSVLGKGTTFTVTLPITHTVPTDHKYDRPTIREAVSAYIPEPEGTSVQFDWQDQSKRPTVLLVEDNTDTVEYIHAILSSRFHFEVEFNGKQGLAKARQLIPDIIISDIMMPEMDGLEMCRQLKTDKQTSHIPIILLTAKADIGSRIEGLHTGADAYLAKPFDQMELLVRIKKLIELRAQLQERYRDLSFLFLPKHTFSEKETHPEDRFMRELHEIIEKNLSNPSFNIIQLCEQVGMSRALLYKKFKALTNQSIADFIRRIRLHKARQLLQTTELNVSQVAMDVGFKNLSTFSRSFTKEFGMNPRDMKRGAY